MKYITACLCIVGIILAGEICYAETLTLDGPVLDKLIDTWPDSGLQLTAKENVVLESFVFSSTGAADLIKLTDVYGTVLNSYSYGGGPAKYTVNVNWDLNAGNTYHLISEVSGNGWWTGFASYPYGNEHIQVDGRWTSPNASSPGGLDTAFWFKFNNLTTTAIDHSVAPEPAGCALMGIGILEIFGLWRRKTKK